MPTSSSAHQPDELRRPSCPWARAPRQAVRRSRYLTNGLSMGAGSPRWDRSKPLLAPPPRHRSNGHADIQIPFVARRNAGQCKRRAASRSAATSGTAPRAHESGHRSGRRAGVRRSMSGASLGHDVRHSPLLRRDTRVEFRQSSASQAGRSSAAAPSRTLCLPRASNSASETPCCSTQVK